MKNILIATDSFKDALPAADVCRAIEHGIRKARPHLETRCFPLADGGEGTYDALAAHLHLVPVETDTCDPLGRPMHALYGRSPDGHTVFIELAKTAGLQLLPPNERNPLLTTTFGCGLQIAHALRHGARRVVLAIGGSATNDGGMGLAAGLGWRFPDKHGSTLSPIGAHLKDVAGLVPPEDFPPDLEVQVICDVTNPLYGPQGAACVYARQKGADDVEIRMLDEGLQHFAAVLARHKRATDDLPFVPGAGAAGGVGFGALFFLNATLRRGIDLVLELTHFDEQLKWADLVVTGEGKIDAQTAHGKLVQGICNRAAGYGIPVVALCGRLEATPAEIRAIGLRNAWSINGKETIELAEMLRNTEKNLVGAAKKFIFP